MEQAELDFLRKVQGKLGIYAYSNRRILTLKWNLSKDALSQDEISIFRKLTPFIERWFSIPADTDDQPLTEYVMHVADEKYLQAEEMFSHEEHGTVRLWSLTDKARALIESTSD